MTDSCAAAASPEPPRPSGLVSRRAAIAGVAWSAPVIALGTAAPAFADSGSVELGPLLESSAVIDSQTVRQSGMYVAAVTGYDYYSLKDVQFTLTVTITYTDPDPGTDSEFDTAGGLSKATVSGSGWAIASQSTNQVVLTQGPGALYLSTGIAGYVLDYNTGTTTAGGWNGPPDGSIAIDVVGTGSDATGRTFTIHGVIMGQDMTTAMVPRTPLVGPDFAKP